MMCTIRQRTSGQELYDDILIFDNLQWSLLKGKEGKNVNEKWPYKRFLADVTDHLKKLHTLCFFFPSFF